MDASEAASQPSLTLFHVKHRNGSYGEVVQFDEISEHSSNGSPDLIGFQGIESRFGKK